jgi:Glutathione S-transferase, N-terminal domain
MAEYQLYCFAQSGNAYRVALMLNLIGADWEPIWVDFFVKGEQRGPAYRTNVNEMGEVPVLVHGSRKLSQSGVILTYLAERCGKFQPDGEDERLEALRWIIFDNQKVNGFLGPYRFLRFRRTTSCSDNGRQSPTCRWSPTFTIRPRSSASTSRPSTRASPPGSSGSRRCRAGSIPTSLCRDTRCNVSRAARIS